MIYTGHQAHLMDCCCLKQSDQTRHLKVFLLLPPPPPLLLLPLLPLLLFKTYKHTDKISACLSLHLNSVVVYWGDGISP